MTEFLNCDNFKFKFVEIFVFSVASGTVGLLTAWLVILFNSDALIGKESEL